MSRRLHLRKDLGRVRLCRIRLAVFARRIVGWRASSNMRTDPTMIPLRIALWQRDREGHPISPGALISHSGAGAQHTSVR